MSRRTELLWAGAWAAAGITLAVVSWRMDRLGDRGINPWSAPGLTPGVVGVLMVVLAIVLAAKSMRADAGGAAAAAADAAPAPGDWSATARALLLCLVFAGLGLGRGLHFAVEAAIFIFVFTTTFSWRAWRDAGQRARGLLQTASIAVVAAGGIAWLFESVFLVRLP